MTGSEASSGNPGDVVEALHTSIRSLTITYISNRSVRLSLSG